MKKYLQWNQITTNKFDDKNINDLYNEGYVFTRIDKGVMDQTRSLRINLSNFTSSSENRRILKKTDQLKISKITLPLSDYHWSIGKLGKDFYETKFGEGTFSANKIKELLTEPDKSNFTIAFSYVIASEAKQSLEGQKNNEIASSSSTPHNDNIEGYCIAFETNDIIHYCYPFYKLDSTIPNLGLGMMLHAIQYAQASGKSYIYLGSAQRPTDTYKLQFEGLEWFDGQKWQTSHEQLKNILKTNKHIHFIGICGVAMSALALAFKREGWKVTGSDVGFYPPISTYLKDNKVDYYPGWHPEKMVADGKPDVVVVGNVAGTQNPEWLYVQEHKLNYKSYPEIIKEFFIKPQSIVCAGTYGKSTSTTLLTWILKETGYNPSYMFGGLSLNDMPAAALSSGEWSVVEGDEYKASRWDNGPKFAYYSPTHLLLTSVVWDHADVYPTEAEYFEAFTKLYKSIPSSGVRVISEQADGIINKNTGLASAFKRMLRPESKNNTIIYGKTDIANYRYTNIEQTKAGLQFDILHGDKKYTITSPCLGEYMADNITGCFAMTDQMGIAPEKTITAIKTFAGMKRRLEKRFNGNITIFDDIAHSPTKAKSVLETLKKIYGTKLMAVFEPNTGNRRPQAASWYDNAFYAADEVIIPRLTKIKIDETEEPPFEGEQLAEIISKTHSNVKYVDSDTQLVEYLTNSEPDTVIIFLGSHGFRGMIEEVVSKQ